jgi:HAMP domain-containing protein
LRLGHLLFLLLVFSGIIPLLISSSLLIKASRDRLKTQETVALTHTAQGFANSLSVELAQRKDQLRRLGEGILAAPGFENLRTRLRETWVSEYLIAFAQEQSAIQAFRVFDQRSEGLRFERPLPDDVANAIDEALKEAVRTNTAIYRFVILPEGEQPGVVIAVPVLTDDGSDTLIVEVLVELSLRTSAGDSDDDDEVEEQCRIDDAGNLLWSPGNRPEIELALIDSELVQDFASLPYSFAREIDLPVGSKILPTLVRIVPVQETGWGVVAHKPADVAFREVQQMVFNTAVSSLLLVILALAFALVAARLFSLPIKRLVNASHEIAAGNFDRRVRTSGLVGELSELADDFNRMSAYVENYIEQLRRAAEANRELFISSIRAFAATIDAKDPYTRGHSERVANYSRAIAQYLGLPRDVQERVWIAAVLHDVGKIGVDDRILKKGGVLTPQEFEQMKLHPVIGTPTDSRANRSPSSPASSASPIPSTPSPPTGPIRRPTRSTTRCRPSRS